MADGQYLAEVDDMLNKRHDKRSRDVRMNVADRLARWVRRFGLVSHEEVIKQRRPCKSGQKVFWILIWGA